MNRKYLLRLSVGLIAVWVILFARQWPPRVLAYHSGSESDLAANPELGTFRSFEGISVDPLAIDPELALVRSFVPSESRGLQADSARWVALGDHYTGIRDAALAADTARWVAIGKSYSDLALVADADTARWVAIGKFYSDLALVADADTARWVAIGKFYSDLALVADADTARWVALGKYYAPESVTAGLPYTDVSQFYAERMRVQAHSLPYTDVSQFYAERMRGKGSQSELAANPELIVARSFGRGTGRGEDLLALNPELIVVRSYEDLVANPELLTLGKFDSCGC